jgi:hypothetical protein
MNDMMAKAQFGGDVLGTIIVVAGALATLLTFVIAFRVTFWPGETSPDHPKNLILKSDR